MVFFASQNNVSKEGDRINFSVDVKDRVAIEKKARQKYENDVCQVKDILRAQIIFPDEGALICGLLQLFRTSMGSNNDDDVDRPLVEVVRIKNSFHSESPIAGVSSLPQLPTGYQHVLVTVRLNGEFLAGTFSFLSSFLDYHDGFTYLIFLSSRDPVSTVSVF